MILNKQHLMCVLIVAVCVSPAGSVTLLDYNSGTETSLTGWTWYENPGPNNNLHPGWVKNDAISYLGSPTDLRTRSFGINTYGSSSSARIDTINKSPSTSAGGSLHVYDDTNFTITGYRSGWWLWYGGEPLVEYGYTDSTTNRMSMYVKMDGTTNASSIPATYTSLHVGTYMCWDSSCPQEGPGNTHYYHYYGVRPGGWVHILVDPQPTHRRDTYPTLANIPYDPQWATNYKHYFEHMISFYYQLAGDSGTPTHVRLDEINFYTETESQNQTSISSLFVGYYPDDDTWEIGWQDVSFYYPNYNDYSGSTFDVRWSISPITNENFDQATRIVPMYHDGGSGLVWRPDPWWARAGTRFRLDNAVEAANDKIYFAVRDVSIQGGHTGLFPHQHGDGHNAPSSLIKTIDYNLRPTAGGITCYKDSDNDLYGIGETESVKEDCSAGFYASSHFTALTGDCDDTNQTINPGGTDTCGVTDRNCDSVIDPCPTNRVRFGTGSVGWGTGSVGQ